ncbi:uncharacterized protein MELLADRAFT_111536 [Melampsora larici-populina 98AG31]|uniref:Wax synthase domain-containing protein n=1 Tax=Melampsora larici-populina (strain 98AG31 / pathotype 3-4-7) TaxID=747676 RepID=F4S3I0_MELLP|nr:uncharacterized protein MELLADRAFT_111536 [Melampsora larici-populina 98AG31]EGG00833.1 hypothetical protein MELLADRAFT_111536 [Melampsora larici-populina 98AG31]
MTISSLINSFWHSDQIIACQPPSYTIVLRFLPIWLQCSLLHPQFDKSSTIRFVRLSLTPLNFYLAITLGIDNCFLPLTENGKNNLAMAVAGFYFAMKALEWGLIGGFWSGQYWDIPKEKCSTRPATSSLKSTVTSSPRILLEKHSWKEVAAWTTKQFFSLRGLQYGWGPKETRPVLSFPALLRRIFLVNTLESISMAYLILARDEDFTCKALNFLSVPITLPTTLLMEAFSTLVYALWMLTTIDVTWSLGILLCYGIYGLSRWVPIPVLILELSDPNDCPPIFDSPYLATSLTELWGKRWHQMLRRILTICGGIPATRMAKKLGGGVKLQQVCGLLGVFVLCGLLHEHGIHAVARQPHPFPHIYFVEFPSALFYFVTQAFGIILEPYIIPYIPWYIGGGHFWVYLFTAITATPYRKQYAMKFRMIDDALKPMEEWNIWCFIIPAYIMR